MMRAPRFWFRPPRAPGLAARLLAPLGAAYAAATRARLARGQGWRAPVPVICLGNLTAGGAGKTPAAIHALERLAEMGVRAHVVTRGHGGTARGPHLVDLARDDAALTGDEALLLAAFAPVWVARDRAAGARAAVAAGAEALVLDDGFQNPALVKDLSILAVDAETGLGNGRPIPAGPLRERPAEGMARADAVLLIGPPEARAAAPARWPVLRARPILNAELRARPIGIDWRGRRVVAFAGIGRPEKFFDTLRALGAELVGAHAFPDHAPYAPRILRRLQAEAAQADAQLVTTEKDAVRLPPAFRGMAMPLPVALVPEDQAAFDALLRRALARPAQG
ncbi:lipid-A-disaccharide kinase [Oceanicella actignis]|uniref:Tetraacyldisaccharide 4'-kinase n=2 Tax=Oceanicella actignis TaxID=1189325 RepID=A0A1M7RRX5_9RHOB|nr:lipid-A-disaccharide kinase [Oceanicella actignis]SHN49009.1 lipid-A-disaccharide kinase [Oceanicella actignis]